MNWNRFLIAGIAAAIVARVISWVWHVPLLGEFYGQQESAVARPEAMMATIIVADLVRGYVLAFIYPFGYKGGAPWMEGLRFGVLLGVFACAGALISASVYNFESLSWFGAQAIFLIIQQAVAGIVIGYVYGTQGGKAR